MRTICLKNFDFASRTHKGLVREVNEDFLAYFDTINGHVFVLCDGMGGHNAGDVAAELATEAVGKYFNEIYHKNPFEAVEKAIIYANQVVVRHSHGNDYLTGMGTTIVVALIRDDRVYYGHAGDSRLYVHKDNNIEQLTTDHSYVQTLLDKSIISKHEALTHPRKNEVTRAVGLSNDFEADVSPKAYIPENEHILMLCSDGLTNMLNDEEINIILNSKYKIHEKANKLIRNANKKGGIDNISVHLIKFHNLTANDSDNENDFKARRKDRTAIQKTTFIIIAFIILSIAFLVGLHDNPKIEKKLSNNSRLQHIEVPKIIAYLPNKNDNWQNIANKFNTSVEKLKALNPNVNNFNKTFHIKIPIKTLIIITQSDQIFILSEKFGISVIDIMKANNLNKPYLNIGSEIIIPLKKVEYKK